PTYPGTYYWEHQVLGAFAPNPYTGKVILLTGPGSQSHIEWSAMALSAMPNVVRVGERTAGADGNITFMSISNDQHFGWTSLGIYYPNGDSTQKIGIVPDTFAYQTRKSLRHGHDDVLEKALQIAGCKLQAEQMNGNTSSITIHPNPANDVLNIDVTNINAAHITVTITDVQGKTIISKETKGGNNISMPVDISSLQPGMYFATVNTGSQRSISKFVKQ
ncbi:MAG: peptidase, partial [Flavipsychrobacter sp.]|nr:peptidase [Flavipsychrobacter sp.]